MFGYIVASKEQLCDNYDEFCSYYCGLCKQMGKSCSQMSRLSLSYDITFMAILLSAVSEIDEESCKEPCVIHPIKKVTCIKNSPIIKYCADMSVILCYEKCIDDWKDDKSIKSLVGLLTQRRAYKKCVTRHREVAEYTKDNLRNLRNIEKENCSSIDEVADKFALILAKLFTPDFIKDDDLKRQLEWFGYNIGRWIYVIDAVNDICEDYKKGSYNPFLQGKIENIEEYRKAVAKKEEFSLTFTLENIAATFDLMNIHKNYELLRKMIYISLPQKQASILKTTGGEDGSI